MDLKRRLLVGALLLAPLASAGWLWRYAVRRNLSSWSPPAAEPPGDGMRFRQLGKSDIKVSEISFGGLQLARQARTAEAREDAMRALARAEELGCNLVDTASVYGDSELLIGEFMQGRRDRWLISTKYSGQEAGLEATLDRQLRRLRTDAVDIYLIHWAPSTQGAHELYEALYRVRKAGKTRLVGVSLANISDIRTVLYETDINVFMVPYNLLEPDPFVAGLDIIREKQPGVIVRSSLYGGLLTGKYPRDHRFTDPLDQRKDWSPEKVAAAVDTLEHFRFLESVAGSTTLGAARYPLAWPEVSTVLVGTRTLVQAEENFSSIAGRPLPAGILQELQEIQESLDLFDEGGRIKDTARRLLDASLTSGL
jgi:aryl-alcohol dehydrogenase-like predicted oxidoreductase